MKKYISEVERYLFWCLLPCLAIAATSMALNLVATTLFIQYAINIIAIAGITILLAVLMLISLILFRLKDGHPVCIRADSLIDTPQGFFKAQDIAVGNKITSYDTRQKKIQIDTISSVKVHHRKKCLRIIHGPRRNEIYVTGSHALLTNKSWQLAEDVIKGDFLICQLKDGTTEPSIVHEVEINQDTTRVFSFQSWPLNTSICNGVICRNASSSILLKKWLLSYLTRNP